VTRFLFTIALIAAFAYLTARAVEHEVARAASSHRAASVAAIRLVFPAATENAAVRVAGCETGWTFNPRAVGRAGERGLFQIHPVHFSWAQPWRLFDPVWNARVAYRLSRGGTSWRAWTCQP
jgi:hypothetical protein